MKHKVSVIVPVYKEEKNINIFLEKLSKQKFYNYQAIVIDGDKSDSTINMIDEKFNVKKLSSEKANRAYQMNLGAAESDSEILLFMHSDCFFQSADSLKEIENALQDDRITAGAFKLKINSSNIFLKFISLLANIRCFLTGVPYGDQGIFIKKHDFQEIKGFTQMPLLEDVDLIKKLKKNNKRIKILNKYIITDARKWKQQGILKYTLKNRLIMLLYFLGYSPYKLKKLYN